MELGVLSQIKILYIFFLDHFKYIRDQLMYNSAKCSCINKSSFDFQQKETKKKSIKKIFIQCRSMRQVSKSFSLLFHCYYFFIQKVYLFFSLKKEAKKQETPKNTQKKHFLHCRYPACEVLCCQILQVICSRFVTKTGYLKQNQSQ